MIIYADHAEVAGKTITLYEAACILARAMQPMYRTLCKEDGYEHYEMAMAVKYNAIGVDIDGEPSTLDY